MQQLGSKQRLIRNRRTAFTVLCLTGFLTTLTFWDVFSRSLHYSHWLVPLDFILPAWAVAAINLLLCAYLLWTGVAFYLVAQGKERVLVAGWVAVILLGPLKNLVSLPGVVMIQWIQAFGMVLAFLAAMLILFTSPANDASF